MISSIEAEGERAKRGILFVTPWLLDGGIERVIANSVPWLAGRGFRCEVASWRVATQLAGQPNPVLGALSAAGASGIHAEVGTSLELTQFRGDLMVGAERSVHDAEESSAVSAGVPAADR